MTGKADFTDEEWQVVTQGPPTAGMIVLTAQRGGTFRESLALAKAYTEARKQHGESELLDEIVSDKPKVERFSSPDELRDRGVEQLREVVKLLERKAAPEEVEEYKRFVLTLAEKVASAHREDGQDVSPAEQAAIEQIAAALGPSTA
ncbi:MAG: hypothetical protein M3R70_06645 [Actinomycetota bacterium]|nr:hypothetical protein [Actinomycetota bacterium]